VYAEGPYRFDEPITNRAFRLHLRSLQDDPVQWLPPGTETWPTTESEVRVVGRSNRAR
jgi:hypothetical protein